MNTIHHKIWNLIRGGSFHGYLRTVSGYPLTLSGCMPEYPVSLTVAGNTIQDGTPSPETPVEIQGCGDRTANLFDKEKYTPCITANIELNMFKSDSPYAAHMRVYYIQAKQNTTYYFSENLGKYLCIMTCADIPRENMPITNLSTTGVVTTSETDKYVAIYPLYTSEVQNGLTYNDVEKSIMVTEGTEPLPYEPYGYKVPVAVNGNTDAEPRTFPIYTDAPIYGNGTISDTIEMDVDKKTAVLTQRYGIISFDGSEKYWNGQKLENGNYYYTYYLASGVKYATKNGVAKSNLIPLESIENVISGKSAFTIGSNNYMVFYTDGNDLATFKNWLTEMSDEGTPLTVLYQLRNNITKDISDKIDWDSISKFWRGTVIITADTTIEPSAITAKYYADKPEEVN